MINKSGDTTLYDSKDEYIRSVKHEFDTYLNMGKEVFVSDFIDEYRRVMGMCLEELWNMNYTYEVKGKARNFHLKHRIFNGGIPSYLQTGKFNCLNNYNGFLSGRMLSCVVNQLVGILRGEYKSSKALKHRFERPTVSNINPMIMPKHVELFENDNIESEFKCFVMLKNLTNKRNENVIIPIKTHKMDDQYSSIGERMTSVLLTKKQVNLLYEIKGLEKKDNKKTEVIGADMGQRKILTLSDGQITPFKDSKGKTFKDLEDKIKRKQKNSKGYKDAITEMKVFTKELMNKLDISNAKELRFESNKDIKKNTGNAHKHWQTKVIKDKLLIMCQNSHVDCTLTPAPFKSQRCFECGYVHKKNRKGEKFACLMCSHVDDADHNSASNNTLKLPDIDLWSCRGYNRNSGFHWLLNGIFIPSNDGYKQIGSAESPNNNTNS